jgi:outer membrane protein, adhesin transport system
VNSSVFSGGASTARARGASHALSAASAAESRVRLETQRVFGELQQDIVGHENVLETLKIRETDMRETGSLYRLQYLEMGTRSLVDLLNAQQELHQLRFSIVNTQHDIRRTQVECLFYSGATRDRFSLTGKRVRGVIL